MKKNQKELQEYFAKRVKCYREAYSRTKPVGLMNAAYHFFWFPLRLIFNHTITYLQGFELKTVLDIGCGCGNFSVELAARGAVVTALDSCKEMIIAARDLADRYRVRGLVRTVHADYLEWTQDNNGKYDLIIAIGLFDYIEDASRYMASFGLRSNEVIITFPSDYVVSSFARFMYRRQGVQGYFYDRDQIENLLRIGGYDIIALTKIFPSTYWVHGRRIAS